LIGRLETPRPIWTMVPALRFEFGGHEEKR
jgi:6-phosphogluconate dehydrogenase (decarboxylating)